MASRTRTTIPKISVKDSTVPGSKSTVTFDALNTAMVPEPSVAFDWHLGDMSQTKMMTARDQLIRAGNATPTEAQIKAQYLARGGKTTS